jgi:hypothetical protein
MAPGLGPWAGVGCCVVLEGLFFSLSISVSPAGPLLELFADGQPDKSQTRILQTFDLPMTPADIRATRLAAGSNPRY